MFKCEWAQPCEAPKTKDQGAQKDPLAVERVPPTSENFYRTVLPDGGEPSDSCL